MDGWKIETRAKSDNYGGKKTPLTCKIEKKKNKIRDKKQTSHTSHKKGEKNEHYLVVISREWN
jgi:hypothetical protein